MIISCDSGDDSGNGPVSENRDVSVDTPAVSAEAGRNDNTVLLVADAWPPFNGTSGENPEGYMIDIAREVFSEAGYEILYRNVSWNRAIFGTMNGDFDGAVGASKSDGKGLVFPEQELGRNYLAFYVKKENNWRFEGIDSLKSVSLGVIESYDYRPWLGEYIRENSDKPALVQTITGDEALKRNIEKLVSGRVDVVVDAESSIRYAAMSGGNLDKVKCAGYGNQPAYIYIAFSPVGERGKTLAKILTSGVEKMRKSGRLQEILDNYGLFDWRNHE